MSENEKVPADALKLQYQYVKDRAMNEMDIRQSFSREDMLRIFFKGIREKLMKRECLSILIKAQTTKGKSTLGFFLMYLINKMIRDLGFKTTFDEKNMFGLISANQIEFLRVARRPDLYNVCASIDEFSHLAQTGAQSSIEEKMFQFRANVCAQKFIHTIMCTPSSEYDNSALIILEVLEKDEDKKETLCKLFYNDPVSHRPFYLGNLVFNVEEVLKKYWYNLYRLKKFYAIELVEKDLIRDVRELEEGLVVLLTYIKCRNLAMIGHSDRNLTKCRVRDSAREVGSVYSIVGEELVYKWAQSLIDLVVTRWNSYRDLIKERKKPLSSMQENMKKKEIKIYDEQIEKEEEKYRNLARLYAKYMSIGNNEIGKSIMGICKKYGVELGDISIDEDLERIKRKYNLEDIEIRKGERK
ncbi:hypothetical protein GF336_00375 [Candidatus Woesearchaeota archaeon]|nr:hypothetical protein [Candidatus Woesearchaeota archaeon]